MLPKENLPDIIKKNIIEETEIETIFIGILTDLINNKSISIKIIDDIFLKHHVFFDRQIDLIIPNKHGTKELQYYSLLNDLFYYFHWKNFGLSSRGYPFPWHLNIFWMKHPKMNLIG